MKKPTVNKIIHGENTNDIRVGDRIFDKNTFISSMESASKDIFGKRVLVFWDDVIQYVSFAYADILIREGLASPKDGEINVKKILRRQRPAELLSALFQNIDTDIDYGVYKDKFIENYSDSLSEARFNKYSFNILNSIISEKIANYVTFVFSTDCEINEEILNKHRIDIPDIEFRKRISFNGENLDSILAENYDIVMCQDAGEVMAHAVDNGIVDRLIITPADHHGINEGALMYAFTAGAEMGLDENEQAFPNNLHVIFYKELEDDEGESDER